MKEYHLQIKTSPKEIELLESCDKIILHLCTAIFTDEVTLYPTWTIHRNSQATKEDAEDCIAKAETAKRGELHS